VGKRAGLTKEDVVAAAARVADRDGLDRLTIASVADALGIQSPSIYHHVDGLDDLRHEIGTYGARELAKRFAAAVDDAGSTDAYAALQVMAHAFRDFAKDHPGLYAAAQPATPLDGDQTLYDAAPEAFNTVLGMVATLGLPPEEQVNVFQSVRAALHGFIMCEAQPGFGRPEEADAQFQHMIDMLDAGLRVIVARNKKVRRRA
jgi:AcrR family transcriptional regulator